MRRATEQELTFSEHVKTVCQIRFYRLYQVCTKCTILIAYEEFFLKWDCILIRGQLQATCSLPPKPFYYSNACSHLHRCLLW